MSGKQLQKILFVEDEEDIRTIANIALVSLGGFDVKFCASGAEAIQEAKKFHADLFLLDVMMPGMDGIQTLDELRKIPSVADTPVIFMTAKVQTKEIENYRNLGAIDVISKPFDPMNLAIKIKEIWRKNHE